MRPDAYLADDLLPLVRRIGMNPRGGTERRHNKAMLAPDFDTYLQQAKLGGFVPVWSDVLADTTTVLGAYWKISHDAEYSFLLESVTGGERIARYSVIGANPKAVMRAKDGHIRWEGTEGPSEGDPLRVLKEHLGRTVPEELAEGLPKFCGGAVGVVAYDYVRSIEKLSDSFRRLLAIVLEIAVGKAAGSINFRVRRFVEQWRERLAGDRI